jgi:hypothetical protein
MKLLIAFTVCSMMLLTAADKPAEKRKPAAKVISAKPLQIPAGAVEFEGGWRYTDAQGKKWIYRKTPFGVARLEDKPDPHADSPAIPLADIKATEKGDYILFERPGPFGTYKWQTKKTELSDLEQAAWKRAQAPPQD